VNLDIGQLNVLRLYWALKIVFSHACDGNITGGGCGKNLIF
jgi:hypothetical protein